MPKRPNPSQIDIFDWVPPSATVLRHPAMFRLAWKPKIRSIADMIIDKPEYAQRLHQWGPIRLGEELAGMGATEHEVAREVRAYQAELNAELARRRGAQALGPEFA